jgi:hypothetical protein
LETHGGFDFANELVLACARHDHNGLHRGVHSYGITLAVAGKRGDEGFTGSRLATRVQDLMNVYVLPEKER